MTAKTCNRGKDYFGAVWFCFLPPSFCQELVSLLTSDPEIVCVDQLPNCCTAGTNLMNLIFQVTELDGSLDTSIHHDEKSGCFHTMSIESDSSSVESAIRYAFVHGSCKVSSLSLPENEGVFSCRVFHSRYPELQMSIKVVILNWACVALCFYYG